jgi:hypothetical protein
MRTSPRRKWLYRTGVLAVTLLTAVSVWAQATIPQYGRRSNTSKGPRALGLIQLFPNGKAHLIPVAIMVDGGFYDAASYKAAPVPMALDFGVVYEAFRTGVSQGLFTVTQPGQAGHNWMAEGTWLPAGAKPPQKGMKYETPKIEDSDAPPRLHRGDAKPATPPAEKPAPPTAAAKPQETAKVMEPASSEDDPNRPILRRGKPEPNVHRELIKNFDEEEKSSTAAKGPGKSVQIIPAISDAGGPDARPYTFDLKPGEEADYRAKMLDLATAELRAKAGGTGLEPAANRPVRKGRAAAKKPTPAFQDVHLRIFDLTDTNEPVLVLSAKTHPAAGAVEGEEITLVARTNLEGEIQKLFFSKTDSQHLYVAPRMELIDAVDADGDGRGELLFRTTSDEGSAYTIYRVTADRLYPLYEGTP